MRPSEMATPLYPITSRLATDFGPAPQGGAPQAAAILPFAPPRSGTLHVICARTILHVLEFARLDALGRALAVEAPKLERQLWFRSDLEDDAIFRQLPFHRVARLPRRFRSDTLGGCFSGACILVGEDDEQEREWRRHPGSDFFGTVPLDFAGPYPLRAEEPAAAFQRAVRACSPRWYTAPGTPFEVALRPAPRFLIHQARFHIGDTLWLTPLLRAAGRRFPGARCTLVGPPPAAELLAHHRQVAEVVVWPENGGARERRSVLGALAGRRFDAALFAFARRPESEWLARATVEMAVPVRVGLEYFDPELDPEQMAPWATHEGWCFWNAMASPRMMLHALDPFGGSGGTPADRGVEVHVASAARRRAEDLLASRGIGGDPFVVMTPGGLSSARWPGRHFAALAASLATELGVHVLLEGAPDEAELLASVGRRARRLAPDATRNIEVCEDPLDVFAAILDRASLLISNDSAPIHFAEALATPTLYFTEQQKLVHSHPRGEHAWALVEPSTNDLRRITVEQALAAVRATGVLGSPTGAGAPRSARPPAAARTGG